MPKKRTLTEPSSPVVAAHDAKSLDDRVRRSREKVLGVTAELLFERGFGGVSVDEISRHSGVAKTTIYRHWPTRADLLRDACSTISTPQDVPDTGSFVTDITALMTNLADLLQSAKWTSVLPSIIDAAERDPDVADTYSTLQQNHSAPFEIVIRRAVAKGRTAGRNGYRDADRGACRPTFLSTLVFPRATDRRLREADHPPRDPLKLVTVALD